MCEKKIRKIKKGSPLTRLREARRMERLQRLASPVPMVTAPRSFPLQTVDKAAQTRVLLALAWKTVALMHKNKLIQQKIIALQKETTEFVETIMKNPENQRRYREHLKLYGVPPTLLVAETPETRLK